MKKIIKLCKAIHTHKSNQIESSSTMECEPFYETIQILKHDLPHELPHEEHVMWCKLRHHDIWTLYYLSFYVICQAKKIWIMEHDLPQPTNDHGENSFESHITNENEVLWAIGSKQMKDKQVCIFPMMLKIWIKTLRVFTNYGLSIHCKVRVEKEIMDVSMGFCVDICEIYNSILWHHSFWNLYFSLKWL